jgi:hypothetical protein
MLKRLNRLAVAAAIDEILGSLAEVKHEEAKDENRESDAANSEEKISPSHVVTAGTACLSCLDIVA